MRKTCVALLFALAVSSIAVPTGTSYSGDAVLRSLSPTRVAVFLDTNADDIIDNGFLLTTDIPVGNYAVRLPAAKLFFTDGYVRIASSDKVYDLQVAGYPDPPAAPAHSSVTTLIGSALMHSKGKSDCSLERAHQKDAGACYQYGVE
ncbi:MAG: hypothetical protein M3Q69_12860 [Acidobacteriota bacterium]|nr:hypothetical protein [Acidobacteriota bacterium]